MKYLNKKSVEDICVVRKKVLLRCDFNVPIDDKGNIVDTRRIDESIPTIKYLMEHRAKIIACSHMGNPKDTSDKRFSLRPVANYLSKILKSNIKFSKDVVGSDSKRIVDSLKEGEVCLLENLRYEPGEKNNDEKLCEKLASLADVYVNDAFGTSHRKHASTYGVAKYLPSACGFLIKKEISEMSKILDEPKHPFVAIFGGAKVSDKIELIEKFLNEVDILLIGGGMSYTFMNALGYPVGKSICETDKIGIAKNIIAKAKEKSVKLVLPVDIVVGKNYSSDTEFKVVDSDSIPEDWIGLDIGINTIKLFSDIVKDAGTIIWNGPMGVCEWKNFSKGTLELGKAVADSNAKSLVGGGDSAAALYKFGLAEKITHISTGGGATIKFLSGSSLPALDVLDEK